MQHIQNSNQQGFYIPYIAKSRPKKSKMGMLYLMGDLHSTKCIIYANLYILNMEKILTYNPIRSTGCVTGENY